MTDPTDSPYLQPTAQDRLNLHLALQQPCGYPVTSHAGDGDWYELTAEAHRCLRLLHAAMRQIPLPQDGPATRHLRWAALARLRAEQALLTLPPDRTAPTTPPPARVAFGLTRPDRGDWLLDTFRPDQTRLRVLTEDLAYPLTHPGTEHARTTADTVRNIVRCLHTYLAEVELGDAAGYLGFTCDDPLDSRR